MTITRRINLTVIILLILMIVMGVVGLVMALQAGSWNKEYDAILSRAEAAATLSETSAHMFIYGAAAVTAPDTGTRAQFESSRWAARAQSTEALNTLTELAVTDESAGASTVSALKASFEECDNALTAAMTLSNTNPEQALIDVSSKVQPLAITLGESASAYLAEVQAWQRTDVNDLAGQVSMVVIIMASVLGAGVVIGIVLAVRTSRKIRRQLGEAATGLSTSAAQLLAVASQVAASTAQTATATNETTATVEEVKQTAQLAHEKASQVADSSQNVAEAAGTERATVEETMTAFERIQNQMAVVTETINRLSDQTQAVGDIISTVNDIAEQSNLLSVNASIEAAKAGDQGKGFTVVAQEVKSLAEQSKQAVSQVRTILGEIQKAGNVAVQAAEQGAEAIEAGRHQIEQASQGTMALADTAGEAAQAAMQISASSGQQLAGMEQIKQAIESINQAGTQAAAGTRQVEQEVSGLRELALKLRRLMDAKATA
ncbi:MAG: chemotaxis protein [Thermoleophilia bacterium]|nr:chemotaxis protein [Thermoleophilia bacterium]